MIRTDSGWATDLPTGSDVPGGGAPGPAGSWVLELVAGVTLECDVLYPNRFFRWTIHSDVAAKPGGLEAQIVREVFGRDADSLLNDGPVPDEADVQESWNGNLALGQVIVLERALVLRPASEKSAVLPALVSAMDSLAQAVVVPNTPILQAVVHSKARAAERAVVRFGSNEDTAAMHASIHRLVSATAPHVAESSEPVPQTGEIDAFRGSAMRMDRGLGHGDVGDSRLPWEVRIQDGETDFDNLELPSFRGHLDVEPPTFRGTLAAAPTTPDWLTAEISDSQLHLVNESEPRWVRLRGTEDGYLHLPSGESVVQIADGGGPQAQALTLDGLDVQSRLAATRAGFAAAAADLIAAHSASGTGHGQEPIASWRDAGEAWLGAGDPLLAADCFGAAGAYEIARYLKEQAGKGGRQNG